MNDAQRSAIRSLLDSSESTADALRALAAFVAEVYGSENAAGYVQESLNEAALHAETADAELEG